MSNPELKLLLRDVKGGSVEKLTYEDHMWGQIGELQEQEKRGMADCESLLKDLRTRLTIQKALAELKKLGCKSEQFYNAFEGSRKKGAIAATEADQLEQACIEPLARWVKNGRNEAIALEKKNNEMGDKVLEDHRKQVESTREAYLKSADSGELALREFEYSEKNKLLDPKEKSRIDSAYKSLFPEWKTSQVRHETAVEEANKARIKHIDFMRLLLASYENLERNRLTALNVALVALWDLDGPSASMAAVDPNKTIQLWIAEHQKGLKPLEPFKASIYESCHLEIPFTPLDPGALPTSPKSADIERKQVNPTLVAIKIFMKQVHRSTQQEAPKSPRKFSPRKTKGASDELANIAPDDVPLQKMSAVNDYKALWTKDNSGFEFVDLYADKTNPMMRHLRIGGNPDDISWMLQLPIRSDHLQSNETQLLKLIYGQQVESRARERQKSHDIHSPMLFHVLYCFAADAATDSWLAQKSTEWKPTDKKSKWFEREGGFERLEHQSIACFSEADLTFRLYRSVWRTTAKSHLVVEYFVRPDADNSPKVWIDTYAMRDDIIEELRNAKLENQPSVLTVKARSGGSALVKAGQRVKAISDFEPERDDSVPRLKLTKGEVYEVLADDEGNGWLQGKNVKGQVGFVACNFVTLLPDRSPMGKIKK